MRVKIKHDTERIMEIRAKKAWQNRPKSLALIEKVKGNIARWNSDTKSPPDSRQHVTTCDNVQTRNKALNQIWKTWEDCETRKTCEKVQNSRHPKAKGKEGKTITDLEIESGTVEKYGKLETSRKKIQRDFLGPTSEGFQVIIKAYIHKSMYIYLESIISVKGLVIQKLQSLPRSQVGSPARQTFKLCFVSMVKILSAIDLTNSIA